MLGGGVPMTKELLIALGLPIAYLVLSTAVLAGRHQQLPRFVQRLTARDALLWNSVVGLTIAVAAIQWALRQAEANHRHDLAAQRG
ncbi:MAG: hypothetical protein EBZ29_03215 [Synechococcaceae bacterium WB9_4xC_028]|nr:hypothetical protein [Synechococcaceae bacterium WB9_4xC_028]